jgi:fatty-acyl-CoA synthase
VSVLVASPAHDRGMSAAAAWDRTDMGSLRCVVTGGTTVTERPVRPWHEGNVPVVQSYGMTETGPRHPHSDP